MLFLDNFTGVNGTLLTAHTPDLGGAWVEVTDYAPLDYAVLLSNAVSHDYRSAGGGGNVIYNAAVMPVVDYSVEAEYVIAHGVDASYYEVVLYARLIDRDHSLIAHFTQNYDHIYAYLGPHLWPTETLYSGNLYISNVFDADGTHVLRLDVSGNNVALYHDDVLIVSGEIATLTTRFPDPGKVGFELGNNSMAFPTDLTLTRLQVTEIAPPNPFWTNKYGQFEII